MTIAMNAELPLRTSAVWGSFGEVVTIPHRYGRVRGPAIRYDDSGLRFVWADHASSLIVSVRVDGQLSSAWRWRNAQDVTGHPVTLIEFSQKQTGEIEADGYGKIDPTTGNLLTNPAAIIADLMTKLAGRSAPNVAWLGYEAAKLGIVCAGEIADTVTLQSAIGAICESVGAVYSPRGRSFARIYPGGLYEGGGPDPADESGPTINARLIESAKSTDADIINAVVIEFAHRNGIASQTIELSSPDSIVRFGRREKRINAAWVADARVAYAVAERVLTWRSETAWLFDAKDIAADVRTLDVIHITGTTKLPVPADAIVLGSQFDPMKSRSEIELERLTQSTNEIRLVRQSSAIESDQLAQAAVATQGDQRSIKLKTPEGGPLANAKVVLDGGLTRYSDGGGTVVFPTHATPPGIHTLTITDSDGKTTTLSLLIQ